MNTYEGIKNFKTYRTKKNFVSFVFLAFVFFNILFLSSCTDENKGKENKKSNESSNNTKEVKEEKEEKEDIKVKALYLTGWNAGLDDKLEYFIDLINKTEVNSVVLNVKDDDGYIGYKTEIPSVKEFGGWKQKYYPKKVIKKLHENNIHVIGRVVCFKDPVLSLKRPDLAIKDRNGDLFYAKEITWLDPYKRDSWPIILETAKEAVKFGFDEIQFDYIRFSNDGNRDAMVFDDGGLERYEIINEFIAYIRKEMPDVVLSGDVFGIICESPKDTEQIGQYLEYIGKDHLDYLSPMVYPSHYRIGQKINGIPFEKPDFKPYEVVFNTMVKAKERVSKVKDYRAKMRPYLQDFDATWLGDGYYKDYGAEDVRAQIKAVYDAGYEEWILWNSVNKYSTDALLTEEEAKEETKNKNKDKNKD